MNTTLAQIKRRFARLIRNMSKEEADAYLYAHGIYAGYRVRLRADGSVYRQVQQGRIGDPGIRYLTGGFSSQTLDMMVIRKLGIRAGIVKNPR